jgi:hypothetical protein
MFMPFLGTNNPSHTAQGLGENAFISFFLAGLFLPSILSIFLSCTFQCLFLHFFEQNRVFGHATVHPQVTHLESRLTTMAFSFTLLIPEHPFEQNIRLSDGYFNSNGLEQCRHSLIAFGLGVLFLVFGLHSLEQYMA